MISPELEIEQREQRCGKLWQLVTKFWERRKGEGFINSLLLERME